MNNKKRKSEKTLPGVAAKRKRYQYTNEELANALQRVKQGENKHLVAAETCIPYSTIRTKLKENCNGKYLFII